MGVNQSDIAQLLHTISAYEKASGQMINLSKSAAFFSSNVPSALKEIITAACGVSEVACHERYLGLPTTIGKNKKTTFDYLIERIMVKVKGWKEKYLSTAGKEILIKSVIQSIPSYAMSCFLLPKGVNQKFEQKSREFWWGNGSKNGVNWLSWESMKVNKKEGGIGFRDMEAFNKALLAKQCWRLLIYPNSLVARLFKAKYYRDKDLVHAQLGQNPSYAWRSLMAGLEVLKKGLIRKLGNGSTTDLFSDPWVDRPGSFCVYSPRVPLADTLVCNYVIDGAWDFDKLNLVLWPVDIVDISRMEAPNTHSTDPDIWRWQFEDSGCYTVKSGYNTQRNSMENHGEAARSSRMRQSFDFTKIWKLKVPKKVCHLLWRITNNIIPTRYNLYRRHIIMDDSCPLCGEVETSFHTFVSCSTAAAFWNSYLKLPDIGAHNVEDRTGFWIEELLKKLDAMDRDRFAVGIWTLWLNRNNMAFRQQSQATDTLCTRAATFLMQPVTLTGTTRKDTEQQFEHATTEGNGPDMEMEQNLYATKGVLQFDGAWRYSSRKAGGGALVLDQFRNVRSAKAKKILWGNRAKEIEALSLEMGIDMAISANITHLTVEGDAEILINQVAGKSQDNETDRSTVKDIVDRILQKCTYFTSICWTWIPRGQNFRAHKLAELGLLLSDSQVWDSDFPTWLLLPSGFVDSGSSS